MTSPLSTARPATAAIAWATKDAIFVEYPTTSGVPFITRYQRNSSGLAQALSVLIEYQDTGARTLQADHPMIKREPPKFSDDSREKAREVLRRLKIV